MRLVLVAEDEHGHAQILGLLLESAGYRVAMARNGREAIELLALEKPALILSDFMMPVATGAEIGAAVRADPALAEIPFVFISGTNESVVARAFSDYDAFVRKPYDAETLMTLVERFVTGGRKVRDADVDASVKALLKGIGAPRR